MGMKQRATKPLSTLLYDETTGKQLIRVSLWVEPEDVEILRVPPAFSVPQLLLTAAAWRTGSPDAPGRPGSGSSGGDDASPAVA